jgi:trigger factor
VKRTVETVDEVTVRLTVEVEAERLRPAFDAAARELAGRVSIPGFRPGKAPRALIEQRVGAGAIASAALDASLSELYAEAVRAEGLAVVAPPEVDVERFDEHEGAVFTATVEVVPEFEVPDHTGISETFPDWDVSESDVDEQLASLRERFAEVEVVDRPAAAGDLVTIRMRVEVEGAELEDASVDGALYEVGSGGVTPALDREVVGAAAGDELDYEDALPEGYPEHGGATARFLVTVTDVREKRLPDLDDDFAASAAAFDTIDELRQDVRSSLLRRRITAARHELRGRLVEAYVALAQLRVPPRMVQDEVEQRIHEVEHQAERIGVTVEQLLAAEGMVREEYESRLREQAETGARARLVLDRLAAELEVPLDPGDLDREILRHAQASGLDPQQLVETIQEQGSLPVLVGDVLRRKAIDGIVAAARIEGAPSTELLVELGLEDAPGTDAPGDDAPGADAPEGDASGDAADADATDADATDAG